MARGGFELRGIIPGLKYKAYVFMGKKGGNTNLFTDVIVESAETKDLGDLRPKADKPEAQPPVDPPANGGKKDAAAARDPAKAAVPGTTDTKLSTEYSVLGTQSPAQPKSETNRDSDVTFTFAGTVVGPAGQPVSGARIALAYSRKTRAPTDAPPAATTDERGTFHFSRRKSDFADGSNAYALTQAVLIATQDGYGFAVGKSLRFETTGRLDAEVPYDQRKWMNDGQEPKTNVLTLVPDDVPVGGRIVNIEGQPIAGARIETFHITEGIDGTLDAWEAEAKRRAATANLLERHLRYLIAGPQAATTVLPVLTDADGWFALKGLGRERIASVVISAPGVETTELNVRSRPGELFKFVNGPDELALASEPNYPNDFTRVVGPSVAVEGRVTDGKTGQPVAGALVKNTFRWSKTLGMSAVTDADGRYRLDGLAREKRGFFVVELADRRPLPSRRFRRDNRDRLGAAHLRRAAHRGSSGARPSDGQTIRKAGSGNIDILLAARKSTPARSRCVPAIAGPRSIADRFERPLRDFGAAWSGGSGRGCRHPVPASRLGRGGQNARNAKASGHCTRARFSPEITALRSRLTRRRGPTRCVSISS